MPMLPSPQLCRPADPQIIAVDLDGSLIREESHRILWRQMYQKKPKKMWKILTAFLKGGRAAAKEALVSCGVEKDYRWTFNRPLLEALQAARRGGVRLILITGAPQAFAESVVGELDLFPEVLGSTHSCNLVGRKKCNALRALLGDVPFVYVGNSWKDLWVWRCAAQSWVVRPSAFLRFILHFFDRNALFLE